MSPSEQALAQQYWDIGMNINAAPLPDYESYTGIHSTPWTGPKTYKMQLARTEDPNNLTSNSRFGIGDDNWYSIDLLSGIADIGGARDQAGGAWYNDGTWLTSPTGATFAVADLLKGFDPKNPGPAIQNILARGEQYAAGAQPDAVDWSFTKEGTPVVGVSADRFGATDAERAAYAEQVKRETGREVANNDQWLGFQRNKDRNSTESAADALINALGQRFGLSVAGKGPNADPNYVAPSRSSGIDRRGALAQMAAMPTLELPGMAMQGLYTGVPSVSGEAPGSASAAGMASGDWHDPGFLGDSWATGVGLGVLGAANPIAGAVGRGGAAAVDWNTAQNAIQGYNADPANAAVMPMQPLSTEDAVSAALSTIPLVGGMIGTTPSDAYRNQLGLTTGQIVDFNNPSPQINPGANVMPTTVDNSAPGSYGGFDFQAPVVPSTPSFSAPTGGFGCFITTAMAEQLGKPDDCDELQTLRWFRDKVMLLTPEGENDVAEYYRIAPSIVAKIGNDPEKYANLREDFIIPAVEAVKNGDYDAARSIYKYMVNSLKAEVLTDE